MWAFLVSIEAAALYPIGCFSLLVAAVRNTLTASKVDIEQVS